MAKIIDDISRTFQEYLLLPGYSKKEHIPANVSLRTPIKKFNNKTGPQVCLNNPFVSAAMQAVTGPELAIALARKGGCGMVFCSQPIESQVEMVRRVKEHKAGFVVSDSNLPPTATLDEVIQLRERTGHSTVAITEGGGRNTKLLGLVTSKDFWEFKDDRSRPVSDYYTPIERLIVGQEGVSLQEATDLLWQHKKECLPIIDQTGNLRSLVFRRDYYDHKTNPDELTDDGKRLFVGAALNTFDHQERAAALIEAGVDALCFDSSDGYSEWQVEALQAVRGQWGDRVVLGGGNVVTADAFLKLVEAGSADFVKVGIGGGSICITREQKGLGRGQASALMEVARARDEYFQKTGMYVPICSDGGLNSDTQIIIALAMGADFVMMGKYFAMTYESPTEAVTYRGRRYKPYWGEGSGRARNWQRYRHGDKESLTFEEGVDAYVPLSGSLMDKVNVSVAKIKATMCNVGVSDIKDFHQNARLTRVSEMTLVEGGTSTVENLDRISSAH